MSVPQKGSKDNQSTVSDDGQEQAQNIRKHRLIWMIGGGIAVFILIIALILWRLTPQHLPPAAVRGPAGAPAAGGQVSPATAQSHGPQGTPGSFSTPPARLSTVGGNAETAPQNTSNTMSPNAASGRGTDIANGTDTSQTSASKSTGSTGVSNSVVNRQPAAPVSALGTTGSSGTPGAPAQSGAAGMSLTPSSSANQGVGGATSSTTGASTSTSAGTGGGVTGGNGSTGAGGGAGGK